MAAHVTSLHSPVPPQPSLTVSQIGSACGALATGAARDGACDSPGDDGADRGDRGWHVTFRSDRGIRRVDNRREGEVLRREWRRLVLRGKLLPVRRSGSVCGDAQRGVMVKATPPSPLVVA